MTWKYSQEYIDKMQNNIYDVGDLNQYLLCIPKPKSKILSAGCGAGREVKFLVSRDCEVTAIDINEEFLDRSEINEPNAEYIEADLTEFTRESYFDYIFCLCNTINFIEKEEKRKRFIKLSYKNLKDGGKLIMLFKGLRGTWHKLFSPYYYYCISDKQIKSWFDNSKFKWQWGKFEHLNLIIAKKEVEE